jgi:hypothetical protein
MEIYRARLRRHSALSCHHGAAEQISLNDRPEEIGPGSPPLRFGALWNVMGALKICDGKDPSFGFQNHAAQARQVFWEFDEVRRLCRRSWEEGYHALAAVIAVAWDTSMSPVDVRTLRPQDRQGGAFILKRVENRQANCRYAQRALQARSRRLFR